MGETKEPVYFDTLLLF